MRGPGILALGFMLASGTAHAGLNFDFSFTNVVGTISGTVTGEIFGLTDNATSAATDLVIDSYPAGLSLPSTPWDIFNQAGFAITQNGFTVTGGAISAAVFLEGNEHVGGSTQFVLNGLGIESLLQDDGGNNVINQQGLAGITFTPAPEPASIALFLSGLFGLRLIRRRG